MENVDLESENRSELHFEVSPARAKPGLAW